MAEKALIVVTTKFWVRDLITEATTGPLIPLSKNALLNAFLVISGGKLARVPGDLTKIRRFETCSLVGFALRIGLLPTSVHSCGLVVVVLAPLVAVAAYEEGPLGWLYWACWAGWGVPLARALALISICRIAVFRLAT